MWLRIAEKTEGFLFITALLGKYQLHQKSVSSAKDMSIPARYAVESFIDTLEPAQKRRLEANLLYTKGRSEFLRKNMHAAKRHLLISVRYAKIELKLKSLLLLLVLHATR